MGRLNGEGEKAGEVVGSGWGRPEDVEKKMGLGLQAEEGKSAGGEIAVDGSRLRRFALLGCCRGRISALFYFLSFPSLVLCQAGQDVMAVEGEGEEMVMGVGGRCQSWRRWLEL